MRLLGQLDDLVLFQFQFRFQFQKLDNLNLFGCKTCMLWQTPY
jgi:hypothetical protein